MISYSGAGTFEVGQGGWIQNTGSGSTINASGAKVVVTGTSAAAGGVVEANSGSAILGTGANTVVIVEGYGSVFGEERSNLSPVINMNHLSNTGDNVFVKDRGSVWTIFEDALYGYCIQTYGNVVVEGGDIYSGATNGRGINLVGPDSKATINGGKIHVDGANGVAISSATTTDAPRASVYVTGGTVLATSGYAIRTTGINSVVEVTGGFVFAYGTAITGTSNVISMATGRTPTLNGNSVVVAWNRPASSPPFVYDELSSTNLVASPAGSATWFNNTGVDGINYANGTNTGFFPIEGVSVVPASYTATFNWNYGAAGAYTTEVVQRDALIPAPTPPERSGFIFGGWFKEAGCINLWNFVNDKMPADDVTLYAKWNNEPPVPVFDNLADSYSQSTTPVLLKVIGFGSEQMTKFSVTFNGNTVVITDVPPQFIPSAAGIHCIEASDEDGKLKIWKYVVVN